MHEGSDTISRPNLQALVASDLAGHRTANDNASPAEQFLALLSAGYDPAELLIGLKGQDIERRFLTRLRNFHHYILRAPHHV